MGQSIYDLPLKELLDLWWSRREELLAFKDSPRREQFWTLTHEGNGKANVARVRLGIGEEDGPHRGWLLHYIRLIGYYIEVETRIAELEATEAIHKAKEAGQ